MTQGITGQQSGFGYVGWGSDVLLFGKPTCKLWHTKLKATHNLKGSAPRVACSKPMRWPTKAHLSICSWNFDWTQENVLVLESVRSLFAPPQAFEPADGSALVQAFKVVRLWHFSQPWRPRSGQLPTWQSPSAAASILRTVDRWTIWFQGNGSEIPRRFPF